MMLKPSLVLAIIIACFFGSGLAGLVYQAVWARYLGLFLGHSSYAVLAVLTSFMGGLAIGNAWLGRRADRLRNPLAAYAWLEIAIGVYAVLFPALYFIFEESFVATARWMEAGSGLRFFLKFAFGAGSLLLPTVCMGATLPILSKFAVGQLGQLRERLALLYCVNSAGAVAGCIVGDFWWIPTLGLAWTTWTAAFVNLAAGVITLWLSRDFATLDAAKDMRSELTPVRTSPSPPESSSHPDRGPGSGGGARTESVSGDTTVYSSFEVRLAIIGAGVSGFAAMLYEVVWTRGLALALGSSTHAFSLMLIAMISGIAAGAWWVSRWRTDRKLLDAFGWAEAVLAGVLLLSMTCYEWLPYWFGRLASFLSRRDEVYPLYALLQWGVCVFVMFVPALCLGVTLPLASRVATQHLNQTGRQVGAVFAVNTAGTVLGTLITGLWILPHLGLARTFGLGVALNAALAAFVLLRARWATYRWPWLWLPACGAVLVWFCGWMFDAAWQRSLTSGLWRHDHMPASGSAFRAVFERDRILFYRDGAGSTVSVHEYEDAGRTVMSLRVNAKPDASTADDMLTQLLCAHVPMLLHPRPEQVLVVGVGSGVSCGAVLQHPEAKHVDVVEISPEVVEASRLFSAHNAKFLEDPRMHLAIEDAKTFLLLSPRTYDVIVSEPSNPWMAGVAGVFTREFYLSCADRLQTNGIMVQWVQTYETSDAALDIVLATFGSVFPYFSIWQTWLGDLVLIGSQQALAFDLDQLARRFDQPAIRSDLNRVGLSSLPALLTHEMVTAQHCLFLPPETTPVHSDFRPVLDYVAQRAFFARSQANRWSEFTENLQPRATTLLSRYLRQTPLTAQDYQALAESLFAGRVFSAPLMRSVLQAWLRDAPSDLKAAEFLARLGEAPSAQTMDVARLAPYRALLEQIAEHDPRPLRYYASSLMGHYRQQRTTLFLPATDELRLILERLRRLDRTHARVYQLQLAELAWDAGDDDLALRLGQEALSPEAFPGVPVSFSVDPSAPPAVLRRMIETHWRRGNFAEAWNLCRAAASGGYLEGSSPEAYRLQITCRKVAAAMQATLPAAS